ncbi:sulfatase-like hydrolase/transferase [Bacteroidota bacterium]
MKTLLGLRFTYLALLLFIGAQANFLFAQTKPNIVVILTDDQGYADISFNPYHPDEVYTPNMDSLAQEGIFFSQAYTSGNTCSPTRAGLMTGRYQHRAGIYDSGEGGSGLPLEETMFQQFLKPEGYVCGAFGKWHLGLTPAYNPISRGFDEFYGFMGRGAHDYYDLDNPDSPLYRGLEVISDVGYLTNLLTDEAVDFIKRHKTEPFFCYLAYNAVHSPAQAPAEDIADFNTGNPSRDILMAMLRHLDNGIGDVVRTLKEEGLWENTLLIFLTDNGGAESMFANNSPLRDFKQTNWEGGIRTPFVISWPAKYQGGRVIDVPIISLDILPTVLDAVGVDEPTEKPFDGKSILPLLTGELKTLHEKLFWSEGGEEGEWAVRYGKWKLVAIKDQLHLSDLEADTAETTNLAGTYPDTMDMMTIAFENWLDEMAEPMQITSKRWTPAIEAGQLMTLFDGLYYNGNTQNLSQAGIYNADMLTGIGDNKTRALVLAPGYDAVVFEGDSLAGDNDQITSGSPYLGSLDKNLSSLVLYPEGSLDMRSIDITASLSPETAVSTMDGDLKTYWDVANKGAWIKYSLCREASVEGIKIAFRRGHLRVAYFDVDVSVDGTTWIPVITGGASNGTQTTFELFSFSKVNARHIRITGYGNSDNSQNHYSEVEFVYGEEAPGELHFEAEDYNRSDGVSKTISDDCQGLLAIDVKNGSYADYDISLVSASTYKMDIRMKALQEGNLDIKVDNTAVAIINFGPGMVDNKWHTISKEVTLPGGDIELSIQCNNVGQQESLFQINWFELSAATTIEYLQKSRDDGIFLYPNPCSEELFISSPSAIERVKVLDGGGRVVMEYIERGERVFIRTGILLNGIYFLEIENQEGVQYLKFIKS